MEAQTHPPAPFTFETFLTITAVVEVAIGGSLAFGGIVGNIINTIVFYRQGPLSNSSTVVFTALSIFDFFLCLSSFLATGFITVFYFFVDTYAYSLRWNLGDFSTVAFLRPMGFFCSVTCYYTTFMAFERAVSVVFPFKVKSLFTPKRCLAVVVVIPVVLFVISIPDLFGHFIRWTSDAITFVPAIVLSRKIGSIYLYINPIFLRFSSVFFVIVCNLIIAWKVNISQKFRSSKANTKRQPVSEKQEKSMQPKETTRDIKLLRMIVTITIVFASTYILYIPYTVGFYLVLKYNVDYNWIVEKVACYVMFAAQLFNSSVNIFIYYNMSSRFREEIQRFWTHRVCKKPYSVHA